MTDLAELLSWEEADSLSKKIVDFYQSQGSEMALLRISVRDLGNLSLEEYAIQISKKGALGGDEKDEGVLLLIVASKEDEEGRGILLLEMEEAIQGEAVVG